MGDDALGVEDDQRIGDGGGKAFGRQPVEAGRPGAAAGGRDMARRRPARRDDGHQDERRDDRGEEGNGAFGEP